MRKNNSSKQIATQIKREKKLFYINFITVGSSIFSITIYFLILFLQKKTIVINANFQTKHFAKEATSTISRNTDDTTFLKNEEKLTIKSKITETKSDKKNILLQNHVITPNIRRKIYEGDTEKIEVYDGERKFNIPQEMLLKNGEKNYIHTQEVCGDFNGKIESNLPVKINDDDLFLSGDNMLAETNNKYLLITKNSHVINTRNKLKNGKNQQEKYDIRSEKMEVFGLQNFAEFTDKVVFTTADNIIKSKFAKAYFNNKNEITDIFLRQKVDIQNQDIHATAKYGYFDVNANIAVLYNDVVLINQTATLNNEIYIYNAENRTSMSFNESANISKAEATKIYNVLEKLSNELDVKHKKYIQNIIKQHKKHKNKNLKDSDNVEIYRSKRAKINLYEK